MDPRQDALLDSAQDSITQACRPGLYIDERRAWLRDAEAALKRVIDTLSSSERKAPSR